MSQSWVLTKDANFERVVTVGMSAGADKDYVPDDDAVVVHSKVIGGGPFPLPSMWPSWSRNKANLYSAPSLARTAINMV